jgi:hypothetical protein
MDTIDRRTLTALAGRRDFPSVSIYTPLHRAGAEKEQDAIRVRNLVASATDALVTDGMRRPNAVALLGGISALLDDSDFWNDSAVGLAVFVEPEVTRTYRIDTVLPEQVVVGGRYYLRPLALALHSDESFFALALDRNHTRLFSGDRLSIQEIELDPAVSSLAEVTKYEEHEESLQYSTIAGARSMAGVGRAISMFHGHGGENVDKDELMRFTSGLEKAVASEIGPDSSTPLVLLGVGYQIAAYRAVNSYSALASGQVEGATDELSDAEIHAKAVEALQSHFQVAVEADLAELAGKRSELVSSDAREIVTAAATGRVKTLFFDDSVGPFGLFDRMAFAVRSMCSAVPRFLRESAEGVEDRDDCGWDLVDLALAETVLHGGTVRAFGGENPPVTGVSAILRY